MTQHSNLRLMGSGIVLIPERYHPETRPAKRILYADYLGRLFCKGRVPGRATWGMVQVEPFRFYGDGITIFAFAKHIEGEKTHGR
jgi:hypothetical protein